MVNYDLPQMYGSSKADCETYLHRIGRTGRFGKTGNAINIVDGQDDLRLLREIEQHFSKYYQEVMRILSNFFFKVISLFPPYKLHTLTEAYAINVSISTTLKAYNFANILFYCFFHTDIKIVKLDYNNIDEIEKLGED